MGPEGYGEELGWIEGLETVIRKCLLIKEYISNKRIKYKTIKIKNKKLNIIKHEKL